ncbi:MAG: pyridoxal 5'-phosphate synthase glutaminase subunit PdxT [Bryobacterales bacterium]|nr:pyridoxal 5'-phosphate synthase glutaminase subunit PdxT [Bryobacterales bacterium]
MRIGILAIQGNFEAHAKAFAEAGAEACEARTQQDLDRAEALVLPGGESTAMLKLLREEGLWEPLRRACSAKPVFATCAGAILLAREVSHPVQESLGLVDIGVERNAYGPQVHSTVARLTTGEGEALEAVFIRAPVIRRLGASVRVLARYQGDPVLVEQGHFLVATFHPELTTDRTLQKMFLGKAARVAA